MNTLYDTVHFVPAATPDALCDQVSEALARAGTRVSKAFFSIVPRYTCGSPAMIGLYEVARVAIQEMQARQDKLTGVFGEELKNLAETAGLDRIAYARWQRGNHCYRYDFLTGKTFPEPKRLTWEEQLRVKSLRNIKAIYEDSQDSMRAEWVEELKALEYRLYIHREEVRS